MSMNNKKEESYRLLLQQNMELKTQMEQLLAAFDETREKLNRISEENETMRKELHDVRQNLGNARNEIHNVHVDLGSARNEIHAVHVDVGNARNEIHKVHVDVGNARNEIHAVHVDVGDARNRIHNAHRDTSRAIRAAEYKISKYMDKEKIPEALCDWYYEKTGKTLDLEHPKTFNEIIQWTKLYDFDAEKCKLVDKYLVRDWVKEKIGENYLIPLLGVWNRAEDIDFDKLPQSFVLKCNHGCHYNIIVKDRSIQDFDLIRKKLNEWLHEDFAFMNGFEMQYSQIQPRIIAEEYIENANEDLYDYKVFCFNGKAKYIMFLSNRKQKLKMQFYDLEWNLQPFVYSFERDETIIEKPDNLPELIECAEKLAAGFIQSRVDFYRLNDGSWKFGEITFTSASGIANWNPPEYDEILGSQIDLKK